MNNKVFKIIVILLCILNIYLLLYKLGDIPRGIHVDEAGSYYDALCLVRYGVDRFLYKYPVYLVNFGGGQSALYTYLACLFFKLLGNSLWSFRLVAVIINLISYYFYYKLMYKYKNKFSAIITLLLLTILPVFIMKARWGMDCYLLCPLLIISFYWYCKAISSKKNLYFIISGILFGITLYTYAISYLIVFLFIVFSFVYLLIMKKISIKNIISMCIPLGIFAFPLILMILLNKGIIKNEIITSFFSVPRLWMYRGGEVSLSNFKYFFNNFKFYFFKDELSYNFIDGFGTVYYFSIVLIFLGFIISVIRVIKNKSNIFNNLMLGLFLIILLVCSLVYDMNINKANAIFICFVYFIVLFFEYLYSNKYRFVIVICLILYLFNFLRFCDSYFIDNSNKINRLFVDLSLYDAIDYADSVRSDDGYIFINTVQGYIHVLINNDVDPYDFNNNSIIYKDNYSIWGYNYYRFSYSYQLNYKNVYILNSDSCRIDNYVANGFKKKKIGEYVVLFN